MYNSDLYDNDAFRQILDLGPAAVPYILEKQQEDHALRYALSRITKWNYDTHRQGDKPEEFVWTVEEFPDVLAKGSPPDGGALWMRWWKESHKTTADWLNARHIKWKEFKGQKKDKEAGAEYQRILDLGIAALPYMVEKVEKGDIDLVPAISELTDGQLKKDATKEETVNWWKQNKDKWLIPFPETQQPGAKRDPNAPSKK